MGDQNATAAPSGTFDAADGPLNIAANRQEQFETLCRCVGRPDLMTDARFATRDRRKAHRDELNVELNRALAARTAVDWEQLLTAVGVPAARILTVPVRRSISSSSSTAGSSPRCRSPAAATPPRVRVSGNGVLVDGAAAAGRPVRPRGSASTTHQLEQTVHRWTESAAQRPSAARGRPMSADTPVTVSDVATGGRRRSPASNPA